MKTGIFAGRKVVYYDSLQEAPYYRFNNFHRFAAIESATDITPRFGRIRALLLQGSYAEAQHEINNLHQGYAFAVENIDPRTLAGASLVYKVDGVVYECRSDEEIKQVAEIFKKEKTSIFFGWYNDLKKKFITNLKKFQGLKKTIR